MKIPAKLFTRLIPLFSASAGKVFSLRPRVAASELPYPSIHSITATPDRYVIASGETKAVYLLCAKTGSEVSKIVVNKKVRSVYCTCTKNQLTTKHLEFKLLVN